MPLITIPHTGIEPGTIMLGWTGTHSAHRTRPHATGPTLPLITRRRALTTLAVLALAPRIAVARPLAYQLDKTTSKVGFGFSLGGSAQTGIMPVTKARIIIDPTDLARSSVDVTVAAAKARTGLFLATEALKSVEVLNTARFPEIRFKSTSIQLAADGRLSGGAQVTGDLTIRGVTHAVTLDAALYRAPDSAPGDLSKLTVRLNGTLSRSAFGAAGYPDLVADIITLDIVAVVNAAP
jgi:polyisoprenoid-binding protein YceI